MSKDKYILDCQIRNLETVLEFCRKVKLDLLKKGDPDHIEKACDALFISIGSIHTVLDQLKDQDLEID